MNESTDVILDSLPITADGQTIYPGIEAYRPAVIGGLVHECSVNAVYVDKTVDLILSEGTPLHRVAGKELYLDFGMAKAASAELRKAWARGHKASRTVTVRPGRSTWEQEDDK